MNNKKILIILSEPRTGSNLLIEAFNLYRPVRPLNEFFIPVGEHYLTVDHVPDDLPHKTLISNIERWHLSNSLKLLNHNDYVALINAIRQQPINALFQLGKIIKETIIIKVHSYQFDELNLQPLLDYDDIEVVLLERSNRLKSYISNQKARSLDVWHNVDTSNIQIDLNLDEFLQEEARSIEWYSNIRTLLQSKNKNYLEVNYEQHLENFDSGLFYSLCDPWLQSIGLELTKTDYKLSYFKKQNLTPIEHSIRNFEEIKERLTSLQNKYIL